MTENFWLKLFPVLALSLTFTITTIMFTWEATRRPDDTRSVEMKRYEGCVQVNSADNVHKCEEFKKLN